MPMIKKGQLDCPKAMLRLQHPSSTRRRVLPPYRAERGDEFIASSRNGNTRQYKLWPLVAD